MEKKCLAKGMMVLSIFQNDLLLTAPIFKTIIG